MMCVCHVLIKLHVTQGNKFRGRTARFFIVALFRALEFTAYNSQQQQMANYRDAAED